jgi:hypothetical protein
MQRLQKVKKEIEGTARIRMSRQVKESRVNSGNLKEEIELKEK